MIEQILSTLGLAKKAGRVEVGEEPVGAAARAKKARVLLVARDAAPSSQRRAFSFAQAGACLCLTIPADKDALGRALGRSSVAMCAVKDIGFAGAIVKKLAAMEPERYGAAAAQLDIKAQRAMERRAEQQRHEKNLRQGKRRTHDAPSPPPEDKPSERERREKPPHGAHPPRRSAHPPERKSGGRPAGKPKQGEKKPPREDRFAGSLPVKRGKGSRKSGGR